MASVTIEQIGERALRRLGVTVVAAADRPALAATVPVHDIAVCALVELEVIAADEVPSPEDLTYALGKVANVHAQLVGQAIVSWQDSAIPQGVAEEYTQLASIALAPAYGKQGNAALVPQIEARVKRVAMVIQGATLATDAAVGIHADLVERGIARWSVWDIPDAVGDAYVTLAAMAMAPGFGATPDIKDQALAERAIARYAALPSSGERVQAEYF